MPNPTTRFAGLASPPPGRTAPTRPDLAAINSRRLHGYDRVTEAWRDVDDLLRYVEWWHLAGGRARDLLRAPAEADVLDVADLAELQNVVLAAFTILDALLPPPPAPAETPQ